MACPLEIMIGNKSETQTDCNKKLYIARDMMEVLNGKWKMEVILSLLQYEKRRFKELQNDIKGVSSKVLSSVLKDLEENHVLTKKTLITFPVTVEYTLTAYGKSLKQPITDLVKLGLEHRKEVMGKS